NPLTEYALLLRPILKQAGIGPEYYAEFGQLIAAAQTPHRAIPYHDFTIEGWVKGMLLPSVQAHTTLIEILADKYNVPYVNLEALDNQFDIARGWIGGQEQQPSELSHALKHARNQAELSTNKDLISRAAHENASRKSRLSKIPVTQGGIDGNLSGAAPPTK